MNSCITPWLELKQRYPIIFKDPILGMKIIGKSLLLATDKGVYRINKTEPTTVKKTKQRYKQ